MPQSPDNNQGPWAKLESYCRLLTDQGNELYIIAGGTGQGGTGSNGILYTFANGNITVPQSTWKVVLVLLNGDNDAARVNNSTRTIAVIIPNTQGIRNDAWETYATTVDQVETLTGYDFFSNVSTNVQSVMEARLGAAPTAANDSISGRVVTPQDFGLTNALITLTDSLGNSRIILTGKLGSFHFTDVNAGNTYILSVSSKRYRFAPQVIIPTEDLTGIVFTPQP